MRKAKKYVATTRLVDDVAFIKICNALRTLAWDSTRVRVLNAALCQMRMGEYHVTTRPVAPR